MPALGPAVPARAADAVLTLLDGSATVVDGARALRAVPGLRLAPAALLETAADTGLLRVEFGDGSVLDLGPATRVMLQPPGLAGSGPRAPAYYLLQGWAKHSTAALAQPVAGQLSAAVELTQVVAVVVSRIGPDGTAVFVESGQVQGVERRGHATTPLALRAGEFYRRGGDGRGRIAARADGAFLRDVPRAFRDTIAAQAARYLGRAPEAQPAGALTYEALAPWLEAEPVIRREFPRRFAALAREPAFREALQRHLGAHPEWQAVLSPRPATAAPAPASHAADASFTR